VSSATLMVISLSLQIRWLAGLKDFPFLKDPMEIIRRPDEYPWLADALVPVACSHRPCGARRHLRLSSTIVFARIGGASPSSRFSVGFMSM